MTKINHLKSLAMAAAMALALFLLAWVSVQPAQAAFPGLNGKIAFQSNRNGPQEIYATSPGGTPERITTSTGSSDPAYSPDGTKVAFVGGGALGQDIFVMNADGTGRKQLTNTGAADRQPAWSPDGKKIAFVANSVGIDGQTDDEIWTINADGTGRKQLTNNTDLDEQPAWSPLGTRIAFVSTRTGDTNRNIYVMNADGSNQTDITQDGPYDQNTVYQGHDDHPAWSPDGLTIAYTHTFAPNASGVQNIWTMTATGGSKVNLQNNLNTSGSQPAWSPDGSMIAYVGATDTNRDIYTMNANGTNQRTVEAGGNPANDINPDWQPITLRIGDAKVKEANTSARFVVSLSGASQQSVTVDYATADGSAKAPGDYAAKSGTITFAPNETSKTVSVAIKNDRKKEPNETFFVNLSNASTTISDAIGKGTIVDND
ncbi:MAG TPA: Calx-beta domain-containing protein [Rubrobacter sp.]|nr:Calx-beta domain-containing protein [Rubrobacter sp.]